MLLLLSYCRRIARAIFIRTSTHSEYGETHTPARTAAMWVYQPVSLFGFSFFYLFFFSLLPVKHSLFVQFKIHHVNESHTILLLVCLIYSIRSTTSHTQEQHSRIQAIQLKWRALRNDKCSFHDTWWKEEGKKIVSFHESSMSLSLSSKSMYQFHYILCAFDSSIFFSVFFFFVAQTAPYPIEQRAYADFVGHFDKV